MDAPQVFIRHWDDGIACALQKRSLVAPRTPWDTGRYVEDQDPSVLVLDLLDPYLPANLLIDMRFYSPRLWKGGGANNSPGSAVSDAKNDLASTFVRQGNTIAKKYLDVEPITCLFELQPGAFRRREQLFEFFECHARITSPFATNSWNEYLTAVTPKSGSRPKGFRM